MLTLEDVIAMPAVRAADPIVLAGAAHLDRAVHWVHTTELADIGPLLRGGDLVLTTGIALSESPGALTDFARGLAESDVAGLVVELGRRWSQVPDALVGACESVDLPLIALRREARFVSLAQAVGERLVDEQLTELREAQRVHETFTELSISEAGPEQILAAVQQLSGATVVLESEQHQVIDYRTGPDDVGAFLDDWSRRSASVRLSGRTAWDQSNGWLVTRLGRRERGWGRLVIGSPARPAERLVAVAERAAAALAMHRLHDRSRDSHVRRLHQELLLGLLTNPADPALQRRAEVAGMPGPGRQLVGLVLRPGTGPGGPGGPGGRNAGLPHRLDELIAAVLHAAEVTKVRLLVAAFEGEVRALVAATARGNVDAAVDRLVAQIQRRAPVIASAGAAVTGLPFADRTLRDAIHVQDAIRGSGADDGVHRLPDLRIRGLLALLAEDERVAAFAERELAPLQEAGGPDLFRSTRVLLENWDNKSQAATALKVSRPVLYDRIAKLERLLGVGLGDAEVRTSLHVALLFRQGSAD